MNMKRLCLLALMAACLAPLRVSADGFLVIDEDTWKRNRERAMINEPEQKAVVFWSKGKEQLIISPSYEGPSSNFAWVVPVPARPKVEILKGAIFHELAELTTPRPRTLGDGKAPTAAGAPPVTVLERKTVGAYDVSVLAATDGQALMKWLKRNKYHLPDKAVGPIKQYVKEKWTFVACRIKAPKAAKGLATGTLAPIRLTFSAKKPVYPVKLSSVNPKPFKLLIHLIVPSRELTANANVVPVKGTPVKRYGTQTYLSAELARGQKDYPTIAKLSKESLKVFTMNATVEPKYCTADMYYDIAAARR